MQALARDHAEKCITKAFAYEKQRWDKSHVEPKLKIGDQVLLSTIHFNNLTTNAKLKDPFIGPFPITELIGKNAVRVELHGAFSRRHPVFPISLLKIYKESEEETFPRRATLRKKVPPMEEEEGTIDKILNKRVVKVGNKKELQFLVSFKNKSLDSQRWMPEKDIPDAGKVLRTFRVERRKND